MFEKWADKIREKKAEEIQFKPFESVAEEETQAPVDAPAEDFPLSAQADDPTGKVELKVVRPESFREVTVIADHLLSGCTVVLNMELLDTKTSVRMYDFLQGVTYSVDGEIKKVADATFVLTPHNVDVTDEER